MDAVEYARVKAELFVVLALPAEAADAHLAQLARLDPARAARVRRLLQAHRDAGDFLDVPDDGVRTPEPPVQAAAGRRIGPFTVEREIGRGGMGTVLLGTRQEGGFSQRVAIKVIRGAGLDARAAERLRDERRILADLNHPLIAHFVDGGTTDDQLPYLAMEYVEGVSITEFCDAHALPVAERVRLFSRVCEAVHYAHQRLVVHRDIKPSNILVTADGTPKLLDFGIAKLLDPLQTDGTATVRVLTPHYASPEQAAGAAVTTSTDVYSLGVLLYELLTGSGPYRTVSRESSPLAVLDAIRREEPERPRVAASRAGRVLHEDLDAILLKALRKHEADRYGSVEQLMQDLARHLDGRPVRAHDGSRAYRLRKFVSRNRVPVAATVIVAVSLTAAAAVATWQARVARAERARADARFQDVRALANVVVGPLYDAIANVPGSTPARQLLVKEAVAYLDGLSAQASDDLTLKAELASAYQKIGDVQGNVFEANLGDAPGALASYRRLLELRTAIAAARPGEITARVGLAEAEIRMGDVSLGESQFAEASAAYTRALAALGPAPASAGGDWTMTASRAHTHYGVALNYAGRRGEAATQFQESIRLVEPLAARADASRAVQRAVMGAHGNLGDVFYHEERYADALAQFQVAYDMARRMREASADDASVLRTTFLTGARVANALTELGRLDEAAVVYKDVVAVQEGLAARDPRDVQAKFNLAAAYQTLADIHVRRKDLAAASVEIDRTMATLKAAFEASPDSRSQLFNYAMSRPEVADRKPSDLLEYYEGLGDALTALAADGDAADLRRQARDAYRTSRDGMAALEAKGELPASLAGRVAVLDGKLGR
jgi:non-specific serine/threonine protein kinase/serine/threonine-protein kinase